MKKFCYRLVFILVIALMPICASAGTVTVNQGGYFIDNPFYSYDYFEYDYDYPIMYPMWNPYPSYAYSNYPFDYPYPDKYRRVVYYYPFRNKVITFINNLGLPYMRSNLAYYHLSDSQLDVFNALRVEAGVPEYYSNDIPFSWANELQRVASNGDDFDVKEKLQEEPL